MIAFESLNDIEAEFRTLLKKMDSLKNLSTNSKTLSKDFRPFHDTRKPIQQSPAQATFQLKTQQRP